MKPLFLDGLRVFFWGGIGSMGYDPWKSWTSPIYGGTSETGG